MIRGAVCTVALSLIMAACGTGDTTVEPLGGSTTSTSVAIGYDGGPADDETTSSTTESAAPEVPAEAPLPEGTVPGPMVDQEDPITGEVPVEMLAAVKADASARTGVAESEFVEIRSQQVTWNDGSLGCPRPGEAYVQIIMDGYWVVLEAGDIRLDYRLTADGRFRLCEEASTGL